MTLILPVKRLKKKVKVLRSCRTKHISPNSVKSMYNISDGSTHVSLYSNKIPDYIHLIVIGFSGDIFVIKNRHIKSWIIWCGGRLSAIQYIYATF